MEIPSSSASAVSKNITTAAGALPPPAFHLLSDHFANNVRDILRSLQAIRNENVNVLQLLHAESAADLVTSEQQPYLARALRAEKELLLRDQINNIERSILESEIMLAVSYNLQAMGADYCKLQTQIRRLNEENGWLREELLRSEHRFKSSENSVVDMQSTIDQLKFEVSLNKDGTEVYASAAVDSSSELKKSISTLDFADDNDESQITVEMPNRWKTLQALIMRYAGQSQFEVAIPLGKQTLEDLRKSVGHDHPHVAAMLNTLAFVYRDHGQYKDAASMLNEALEIRQKTLGPEHPLVATTLNNLAVLSSKRGKYKEAEAFRRRALEIREKVFGPAHADVAKQLLHLALLIQQQTTSGAANRFAEIEENFKRAIKIYEAAHADADNTTNAEKAKNDLAAFYTKNGRYRDAEMLYKEILSAAHDHDFAGSGASKNSQCFRTLWKVAEKFQANETENFEDAEEVVKRFIHKLNECSHFLGVVKHTTPTVLCATKNLALLHRKMGKSDAALVLEKFYIATKSVVLDYGDDGRK